MVKAASFQPATDGKHALAFVWLNVKTRNCGECVFPYIVAYVTEAEALKEVAEGHQLSLAAVTRISADVALLLLE